MRVSREQAAENHEQIVEAASRRRADLLIDEVVGAHSLDAL